MSDESQKFIPGKQPKFPKLIMRAYIGPGQFIEWIFTPPDGGGWFTYSFESQQENGILHINFDHTIMTPKTSD